MPLSWYHAQHQETTDAGLTETPRKLVTSLYQEGKEWVGEYVTDSVVKIRRGRKSIHPILSSVDLDQRTGDIM